MLSIRRCILFSLLTATLFGGAARGDDVTVEQDISYRTVGETGLKLDLARPAGEGPFPALLFIHGGGWHQGSRDAYSQAIRDAAERGYVAATITYRLMEVDEQNRETAAAEPRFPAQIHDVKAAVRWLRAHADRYRVDPERIGVTGASAGGHLSLLVGLAGAGTGLDGDGDHRDQSSRVQAVANFFGPTAMAECYETSSVAWIFRLFLGGTPEEAPKVYKAASPVTYVTADDPPVLSLHGDQDRLVPVAQAKRLDEAMNAAGAPHELIILAGQGHGFGGDAQQKAMTAMWEFFDQQLESE